MPRLFGAALLCATFLQAPALRAQGNHVIIRDFRWKVVSTEHFDVHYYEDSAAWIPFATTVLERSYQRISKNLGVELGSPRRPFFLYANANDMEQSNIVEVGDGTGGVTEPFKDRFIVYNDGSRQWLDDVITHELTHVFQYHILLSGFWRSARILKSLVYPLWMMEGSAEFSTRGLDDTETDVLLRDASTSDGLIPLWKLEHFSHLKPHQIRLAYESGETAMEFLESQFGKGKVGALIKLFETHFESSSVLQALVGLDIFAFDKKWREYETELHRRVVRRERLREPETYGISLTGKVGEIPQYNTSPVFSPDGARMAYFSTSDGFPPVVMLKDLRTGKARALVKLDTRIENILTGNFANLSRNLAMSPDGSTLAFNGTKNHRDSLFLYDLKRGRLHSVPLPGFQTVTGPAFSPDGRKLAFSGMKEGFTDLYLLDLGTREVKRLTNDPADDQNPNFSPDGRSIVYSSEIEAPGDPMLYQRRLYRLDLADLSVTRLPGVHGAARDPVYSADGKRILFALEDNGFYEVHELELDTSRIRRLTRSIGGAYTPTYTPAGDVAFAVLRRGDVHIYRATLDAFPGEDAAPMGEPGYDSHVVAVSTVPATYGPERPAKSPYDTDLFFPAAFYSSNGGLFWTSYYQGSDLLGNHQVQGLLSYASGQGYLNYQTQYSYSRLRPQLSVAAAGYMARNIFDGASGLTYNDSVHKQAASVLYPLDRYKSVSLAVGSSTENLYAIETAQRTESESRIAAASFDRDTLHGRYLVATEGSHLRASYLVSPRLLGGNTVYQSYGLSGVKYFPASDWSALVLRGVGVQNIGPQTPQEVLGGLGGVRGYGRSTFENVGSREVVTTAEFRFPIVTNLDYYVWFFFPDFYFKAITAAVFTDAGYVWSSSANLDGARWGDMRQSYGGGLRLHTFILQLYPLTIYFDYARRTTSNGGIFYVYLGPLF